MPARRHGADSSGDARHHARERALALLYEAELKHLPPADVLAAQPATPDPLATELVEGVSAQAARIDGLIGTAAVDWEVERMPVVDRTILRLATYELLERSDTPVAVIIDEAVELAKEYSTEQSGGFVNGVLVTVARGVRGDAGPDRSPSAGSA
jgi:N utilization substance protein B